mmetsp:Transcript_92906/g.149999  ORF Transcript_92906/g.149999 Transcript_92906/m.149999 type:complete len:263 (+) Transcript_92906:1221-2009(+)
MRSGDEPSVTSLSTLSMLAWNASVEISRAMLLSTSATQSVLPSDTAETWVPVARVASQAMRSRCAKAMRGSLRRSGASFSRSTSTVLSPSRKKNSCRSVSVKSRSWCALLMPSNDRICGPTTTVGNRTASVTSHSCRHVSCTSLIPVKCAINSASSCMLLRRRASRDAAVDASSVIAFLSFSISLRSLTSAAQVLILSMYMSAESFSSSAAATPPISCAAVTLIGFSREAFSSCSGATPINWHSMCGGSIWPDITLKSTATS